jgi:hypothetical protein
LTATTFSTHSPIFTELEIAATWDDRFVAVLPPQFRAVPAPIREEAEALRLAEAYLTRADTQVASRPFRACFKTELGGEILSPHYE